MHTLTSKHINEPRRLLTEMADVEPRESKYDIGKLIRLCSRKDINDNGSTDRDLIEISLCFANEIKRIKQETRELKYEIDCIKAQLQNI